MRKRLYVLAHPGLSWMVRWEGALTGSVFSNKEDAKRYARRLVGSLAEGTCSQILVQKRDGQWELEWTYGKDPFPPEG